ncbi:DUF2834 domain-containing protein [Trichothermofontia sichuanensis B231]|uniref:DUF2834 domain-containing protein n=1 Tax=Trichothermofontia sichuanensis TaxID=3045816 RepID=UPI00224575BF|nr:DUF2834 domain-containing protein [Trichothermofontia sichuanensis]UZQ54328.1 DUF2834 domain-containing protein [Trichothermofontia sichuanensis B231]
MARKLIFSAIWLALIFYAFGLAPAAQPDTLALIQKLSLGQLQGINPLIVALFNLMGIWPLLYASVLLADGRGQKLPASPFVALSFGVGAFALLPYLAWRQPNPSFQGPRDRILRFFDSRWLAIALTLGAIALLAYGLSQGDWADFAHQWQTNRFIHVMSLDFCLLALLFPAIVPDDMARRQFYQPRLLWLVSVLPLLGPLAYLILRPPLPEPAHQLQPTTNR